MANTNPFSVSGIALWQWRKTAQAQAAIASVPIGEIDWLLQEWANLDRLSLKLESFQNQVAVPLKIPFDEIDRLWQQRLTDRVPVQYLTGIVSWRQFSLIVSPAVLIPRPETECLIDLAIAASRQHPHLTQGQWADLGTGSGAIALGLADTFPLAQVHAVDVSAAALEIAKQNADRLQMNNRIDFHQGSWFEPLESLQGKLSGMVSNPPYIPDEMVLDLQPEVARHEPHLALDGGSDGLDCIRHLIEAAPQYLISGGLWLIEMMAGQAETVTDLLKRQGSYCDIQIHADLAGVDRFALAYRY